MRNQMSADIPINVSLLPDAVKYFSGVVQNFRLRGHDPETSVIRFGDTGTGLFPNYRIERQPLPISITIRTKRLETKVTPADIFNGRTQHEMAELYDQEWQDGNWTCSTMRFSELVALLAQLDR